MPVQQSAPTAEHAAEQLLAEARNIVHDSKRPIRHIAFVVDGNRRWARQHRHANPIAGHRRALEVVLERVEDGAAIELPTMSFWLFSSENWRREAEQVNGLFNLGRDAFDRVRQSLLRLNARFRHIGRKDRIPRDLGDAIAALERETSVCTGILTIAAIDYGGRDEIVRAANRALKAGVREFTEDTLTQYLDTAGVDDPDLVIRTSGELRTSGYMVWQAAYSEWLFPKAFFPDLGREEFVSALREYAARERRFGG